MRRMIDPKTIGGGGGGGEIHIYDVQYRDKATGEFYLSFVSNKVLPGFTKPGDILNSQSMKDYPEFFPKRGLVIPCSGAIKKDTTLCQCIGVRVVESEYDSEGYVRPKIIYNGNSTTAAIIPTNSKLTITRRY